MAPASSQDREDVSGESGYRAAESTLLHAHLPPLPKNSLFYISFSVYTFRSFAAAPSKQRQRLCSQLMGVHGQELPSTAAFLLGSAKADVPLNSGENWLPPARICARTGFSLWSTHFG